MKKILQLLGILAFVICNYGNAKELKCEYELKFKHRASQGSQRQTHLHSLYIL